MSARLVLLVPVFPRLSETFIVSKFIGLVDSGWDVHIVCAETDSWAACPQLSARPELRRRVHRQWPHAPRWKGLLLWLPALAWAMWRAPRSVWRYWCEGRRRRLPVAKRFFLDAQLIVLSPDIVHFEFATLAVGRTYLKQLLGCRLSASFRGYDAGYVGLEHPDYYVDLWRDADAIHVLGADLWHRVLRRGCPPDKPHAFIPPAVDSDYFSPEDQETGPGLDELPAEERPLRILSVGRLEWKKGYEYALEAVALLRERRIPLSYRIVGGGAYLEALAFARYQLGLEDSVELLGPRPQTDVLAQLRWADVLLHPAVSEGFSNAVLEAQAMGLPVVATDADGLPENVEDGVTGFIVPRREPEALAAMLARLAADPDLRRRLGQAGRERVRRCFRLPDQIAAFDRFYGAMVTTHAR